jgi:hypothetical protein
MPEGRWTQRLVYGTASGSERLYLAVCVINSSGHGGAGYNGGTWTITRRDGTVSGVVTDGYETQLCCPGKSVQRITLVATSGTGSFENATGTLYAWSCEFDGLSWPRRAGLFWPHLGGYRLAVVASR